MVYGHPSLLSTHLLFQVGELKNVYLSKTRRADELEDEYAYPKLHYPLIDK